METQSSSIQLSGMELGPKYPPPKKPVEDPVLIIYSVANTSPELKEAAVSAVNSYRRADIRDDRPHDASRYVRTRARVFEIPTGAAPRGGLAAELGRDLTSCVGAIAFVDDMRPNIAYELGFFHGKGAPVLLLTTRAPERYWKHMSDLAGAAVGRIKGDNITSLVHHYLDSLFEKLEVVDAWPTYSLPARHYNLLTRDDLDIRCEEYEIDDSGEFGRSIRIANWENALNIVINRSLPAEARFKVALRTTASSHYSIYFEIGFHDCSGRDRQVWLGLSSWLNRADFRNDERNLPADPANNQWRYITGTFAGLLRQGQIHQARNLSLKRVRFRAGEPHVPQSAPLEIGYLDVIGLL